jgi:hypothetical protein
VPHCSCCHRRRCCSGERVVALLEDAAQRCAAAERLRAEAAGEAATSQRLNELQAKQIAALKATIADLHRQLTALQADSGDAVSEGAAFTLSVYLLLAHLCPLHQNPVTLLNPTLRDSCRSRSSST